MSIEVRVVELASGGRITLEVDVDWLHASDDDLAFVRDLARRMDRPEPETAEEPAPPPREPEGPAGEHHCETCGRDFASAAGLGSHRRTHGVAGSSKAVRSMRGDSTGDVLCPDCGRGFATDEAMRSHRGQVHRVTAQGPASDEGHRLADLGARGSSWQALCTCGLTCVSPTKDGAREAFREHMDAA